MLADILPWEAQKKMQNFKKGQKKSQKLKINQKFILHFSEASLHVLWCFIPQKNSRASLITWLKGYSVIFTYDREISKRSWGGNRGTPCSLFVHVPSGPHEP